jgi:hypothetical protein
MMIMVTFMSDALPLTFPRLLNCLCFYVFYSFLFIAVITPQKMGAPIGHLFYSAVHTDWQSMTHEGSCSRQSKTKTIIFIRDLSK